jgi:uncharacterized membrane protein|nr:MAG: hypothetical protein DIU75_02825 [Mycolicibacterium hassiacum]
MTDVPPPPGGSYPPPPPAGGYPPPPAGPYPPQPGYPIGPQYSVGDAFTWAWNKFSRNAAPLILSVLVYAVILGVLWSVGGALLTLGQQSESTVYEYGDDSFYFFTSSDLNSLGIVVLIVLSLVHIVVMSIIGAAFLRGLLDIADGRQVTVGSFFRPQQLGNILLAVVLISLVESLAFCTFIGPIVIAVLTWFTYPAILERGLSAVDGIKAAFEIFKADIGATILAFLVVYLIFLVGAIACLIGLFVAVPVAALFYVYTYRKLSGGQVSPLTP